MADYTTILEYSPDVATLQGRIATALESIATSLAALHTTDLPGLKTSVDTVKETLDLVKGNLEVDLTNRSLLLVSKTQEGVTGTKSIAYVAASTLQTTLEGKAEATSTEEPSTDPYANLTTEQRAALALTTKNAILNALISLVDDFVLFTLEAVLGQRIYFQTENDFLSNKKGLPFDFTRYIASHISLENVEVKEYLILPYENTSKVSTQTGETNFDRVKTWINILFLQTLVTVTNKVDGTTYLYFPAAGSVSSYDSTTYKTKKLAIDSAVASYEKTSGTSYSYSIIPVSSISQGITREVYREQAKLITPEYEYS